MASDPIRPADEAAGAALLADGIAREQPRVPWRDHERITAAVEARTGRVIADVVAAIGTARDDLAKDVRLRATDGEAVAEALAPSVFLADLAEQLPLTAHDDPERATLLLRLTDDGDAAVVTAARALTAAMARDDVAPDLPPPVLSALVWQVAAALRPVDADPATDCALIQAAEILLAEAGASVANAAMALAQALDPGPEQLDDLVLEALDDRQPALVAALLAHAGGLAFADVAALLADPADDRLWLLCRAEGLARATIARIGVALAHAQPTRELETFADTLDAVLTVAPTAADAALERLRWPNAYRAALDMRRTRP